MLTLMTGLLFFLAVQDDAPARDFTQDFTDLCRRLVEAKSYSFQAVTEEEGGGFGMGAPGILGGSAGAGGAGSSGSPAQSQTNPARAAPARNAAPTCTFRREEAPFSAMVTPPGSPT